jgi:NAD-dependent dihydropyrimidine dehydrogenase PreA subunit
MRDMRYLSGVAAISLDAQRCVGCGLCEVVCPHGVLAVAEGKAGIVDRDGCMECGACATNCPAGAIAVTPGVGCAAYILQVWLKGKAKASCC